MKTPIAAALLVSSVACAPAFAAVEPVAPVAEIKIRKTQERTADKAPDKPSDKASEQEQSQDATRTTIGVSVRLRTGWADIRLHINI
ncbi:hypothetical protein E4K72_21875 [Oxalobacteraceae bacterium OM1]|nr:hypothetical protein E4K72_21875 [Oxalobacteraceae bacterium OM1]